MRHFTKDVLRSYMNAKSDQEKSIEKHLLECDKCMDLYLSLLEEVEINRVLSDDFTEVTLHQIEKILPSPPKKKQNTAFIHYLVAAGLTILLTLTGVFQGVLNVTEMQQKQNNPSVTDQLMTKTNDVLEEIKGVHHNE